MKTLSEIGTLVGGKVIGDPKVAIRGIASVGDCKPDEITFALAPKFIQNAANRPIGALLVKKAQDDFPHPQVVVADPKMAAFKLAHIFAEKIAPQPGKAAQAHVCDSANVDPTASLAPFAYVGEKATVGKGTVLYPGAYVGDNAVVGENCTLHPGVVVGERCEVGDNTILHNNVSIGADGFGFFPDGTGGHAKIPQMGIVAIGKNVEIGACSCIDRATFGRTVVGDGVKIDNLVQVGHNCLIGANSMLISQVGLAGSVDAGENVLFAARAAVSGHLTIGQGAVIGGGAGVLNDVPEGEMVGGFPARNHIAWKRSVVATQQLPQTLKKLRRLEKRVAELEKNRSEKE
jgi:UDP-3-O-[3-hydroxymyristoyl] glucosamine N-acyltransferase